MTHYCVQQPRTVQGLINQAKIYAAALAWFARKAGFAEPEKADVELDFETDSDVADVAKMYLVNAPCLSDRITYTILGRDRLDRALCLLEEAGGVLTLNEALAVIDTRMKTEG